MSKSWLLVLAANDLMLHFRLSEVKAIQTKTNHCQRVALRVQAALCAGLYPRVVKVVHPKTNYHAMAHGAVANSSTARELKLMVRSEGGDTDRYLGTDRVFLHPSSINFHEGKQMSIAVVKLADSCARLAVCPS
jgi:hypothetical protein